jgi:spore maturation protein CgeB
MKIVIVGLSITSSWGNGHASTYRALVRALAGRGHDVLFLERDLPWYRANRDLPHPPYCRVELFEETHDLGRWYVDDIGTADLVIIGSYVPDGIGVIDTVQRIALGCTAFYDIDTPVTLAALRRGNAEYLDRRQIEWFDLYLSFTGGPTLQRLEQEFGARRARPLYCSVDAEAYLPSPATVPDYDLGYLGTYSTDRQPALATLLNEPARAWPDGRFVVAGPQYPESVRFAPNVERMTHVPPAEHPAFYNRSRFTLNITRRDMIDAGYSPSVRLFEAAACGTPIISDRWLGLNTLFVLGQEILLAETAADVLAYLREMPEADRRRVGQRGRERVLASHTSTHRATELEEYVAEAIGGRAGAVAGDPAPSPLTIDAADAAERLQLPARDTERFV